MITIKIIDSKDEDGNEIRIPERELTEEEKEKFIFTPKKISYDEIVYFDSQEEFDAQNIIQVENNQGSIAFEAFKQCSVEEKKLIAESLKEFL